MKGKLPERRKTQNKNEPQPNPNDPRTSINPNTQNQNHSLIDNQPDDGVNYLHQNELIQDNNNSNNNNQFDNIHFQNIKTRDLQRRMRTRHLADGAVSLNVENDDLANENYDLYDNKDINFDKPKINENIGKDRTEYYVESIRHDRFFKITEDTQPAPQTMVSQPKQAQEKPTRTKAPIGKQPLSKSKKPLTATEIGRMQEDKIFAKFDDQLTEVITKTTTKVFLLFLFTQGLLAGMALLHLIFFLTKGDDLEFLKIYAVNARESFNVFHTLTFASLVGNGIKFISAFQRYRLINIHQTNSNMFTELRKNMIFSGILLVFFTITFGLEIYLTIYIPRINLRKCGGTLENPDYFNSFTGIYLAVDFIVIILFILNIFDVTLKSEYDSSTQTQEIQSYQQMASNRNPEYDETLETMENTN